MKSVHKQVWGSMEKRIIEDMRYNLNKKATRRFVEYVHGEFFDIYEDIKPIIEAGENLCIEVIK